MSIPYGRQTISDSDVEAVVRVLRSDWLTQGPEVEAFEGAFAAACEAPWAVSFSSGTAALHAAMIACGLGPGDELVTSAITFCASANAGAYVGATPRFADIDPATLNISAETVTPQLSEQTRVVVPVDFTGLPAPVGEIRERLGEGVRIVRDACHALGARNNDGPVGSCAAEDLVVFSLHPVKSIAAGEGGMVTGRDPELRERLLLARNHGFVCDSERLVRAERGGWYHEQQELGFNFRLSDLHSALGRSQLGRLEEFVERRNAIAERYREALADVAEIELPPAAPAGSRHAYHLFVIRHRAGEAARRSLFDGLRARGIGTQVHYIPVYHHPWYERTYGYQRGLCPEAERYYESCATLPCFPTLAEDEQAEVIAAVRELA